MTLSELNVRTGETNGKTDLYRYIFKPKKREMRFRDKHDVFDLDLTKI